MPTISEKIVFHLPMGELAHSDREAIAPSSPPLVPPLLKVNYQTYNLNDILFSIYHLNYHIIQSMMIANTTFKIFNTGKQYNTCISNII